MITQCQPPSKGPLFVFAGGGTGGHIYPAIAVAHALRSEVPEARFLFLGTQRPIDRHITATMDCEFVPQNLTAPSAVPWRMLNSYLGFRRTGFECQSRFEADRPAIVVGTGGMASVPAVREAFRAGIPTALFNPDSIPGKANRYLAPKTRHVFVQFEETIEHFPGTVEAMVYGCPVRPEFHHATRAEGIARFGLEPGLKTLLVTGASLGARTVNQAVVANADFFTQKEDWQILHLTGEGDFEMVKSAYGGRHAHIQVLAYTNEMAYAMAAADLIVSRAGASTLAEIIALGRASILMPYPFHRDQHQRANAGCLADGGAAQIVNDAVDVGINKETLRASLFEAMQDESLRKAMGANARRLGADRRDAARQIARKMLEISGMRSGLTRELPAPLESLKPTRQLTR